MPPQSAAWFSASTAPNAGLSISREGSEVVLDSASAANLSCFKRLRRQNGLLEVYGFVPTASLKFGGGGKLERVQGDADVPVAIACCREAFAICLIDADIPSALREGALETMGEELGGSRNCLNVGRADVPLRSNAAEHYVLNAASFDSGTPPAPAAVQIRMALCVRPGRFSSGARPAAPGICFLGFRPERRLFMAPRCFLACKAVTRKNALNANLHDAWDIVL